MVQDGERNQDGDLRVGGKAMICGRELGEGSRDHRQELWERRWRRTRMREDEGPC